MKPYLSVIVPVYKAEAFLKRCVDSILRQDIKDMEVLLVNDGSPDRCPEICDAYAAADARVRVIHKENGGSVSARKAGVGEARGEYVAFADSDDWMEDGMYRTLYELSQNSRADILITGYFYDRDGDRKEVPVRAEEGLYEGDRLEELRERMIYDGTFYESAVSPALWNKWYRRELIRKNLEPVDERITWGDDMACTYPCMMDAESVYIYKAQCFYHYCYHAASMTETVDAQYFRKFQYLYEYLDGYAQARGGKVLAGQLKYHKLFTTIYGLADMVRAPKDFLGGGGMRRLKEAFGNEDIARNMEGVDVEALCVPFPNRQIYSAFLKKRGRLLFVLLWLLRVRNRIQKV